MESSAAGARRRLVTAEILSIGTEITSGETRDTNAGELARSLAAAGLEVLRLGAVSDRREAVEDAFRSALTRADLVVSTGGLGPTPDDLTRESLAAVCDETPVVDPGLETWLRGLWSRRGMPFPEINLKQAWLIPSAEPSPTRTGPRRAGWSAGQTAGSSSRCPARRARCARCGTTRSLPEPACQGPRRGFRAVRTLRLTGIGESIVADRLGERASAPGQPRRSRLTPRPTPWTSGCRRSASGAGGTAADPARPPPSLLDRGSSRGRPGRRRRARLKRVAARPGPRHWTSSWCDSGRHWPCAQRSGTAARAGDVLGARTWLTRLESLRFRRGGAGRSIRPRSGGHSSGRRRGSAFVVPARPPELGHGLWVAVAGQSRRPPADAGRPERRPGAFPRGASQRPPSSSSTLRADAGRPARDQDQRELEAGDSAGRSARGRAGRR